jgi:precorrin-2 dehydrogenase/sirohydrochlorin ferrochelatase
LAIPKLLPPFDLPIFLNTDGLRAMVVGGGVVGRRKALTLLAAGVPVRVVDPKPQPDDLRHSHVEWVSEPFRPEHLRGCRLVYTATSDEMTNRRVAADARALGLLVCRADTAFEGDFLTPTTVSVGHKLKIAVSTGGASPALARRIRDRLAELFDDSLGAWVDLLEFWRAEAATAVWDSAEGKRQFLDEISDWKWLDRYRSEGHAAVTLTYRRLASDLGLLGYIK